MARSLYAAVSYKYLEEDGDGEFIFGGFPNVTGPVASSAARSEFASTKNRKVISLSDHNISHVASDETPLSKMCSSECVS